MASKEKTKQSEARDNIERDLELLIIKSAQSARDTVEKTVIFEKQNFLRTSLEKKNVQLGLKKTVLESLLVDLESELNVKEQEFTTEKNRISLKRKESADRIIENKRIEDDLAEIREMESNIRKREREVEMMEIERNRLVQLENIEQEKLREAEITEILKRADDIANQNIDTNFNTTKSSNIGPGKGKSSNPFSKKEKYIYKKKEEVFIEMNKNIDPLELKRKEEYMYKRSNNNYLNLENFYTI